MTNTKRFNNLSKSYYMYGKHAVLSALNNKHRNITQIFCNQEMFDQSAKMICAYKYEIMKDYSLNQMLKQQSNHQGIIAKVYSIFHYNIDILTLANINKLLILDQITDPQNIGSIIRSAAAFNIESIILPIHHTPDENATIAKAASGALEFVKIIKVTNLHQTIKTLKTIGFWIIGFDGNAITYPSNNLFTGKIAMVFGAEDTGLRRLTAETCDYLIKIPISKNIESLNVANAVTIALYLSSLEA